MGINISTTKLDALYQHLWAAHREGPFAVLDQSLKPRPSPKLFYNLANQLDRYEVTLALYHWGLYQLLGKLSSTFYLWRKVS